MVNRVRRTTLIDRHVQGLQHQLRAQVRTHAPADDPAAPDIQDDRQVDSRFHQASHKFAGDLLAGSKQIRVDPRSPVSPIVLGLIRLHEFEPRDGIDPVSCANQDATFSKFPSPRGAPDSLVAVCEARRVPRCSGRLGGDLRRDPPGRPSCGSTWRSAHTPWQALPDCVQIGPIG